MRPIEPRDDATVAAIIRETLGEFGCSGPGFAHADAEVDAMHAAYQGGDRGYYVVEIDGEVLGCGGFAPLLGQTDRGRVAEVRKMYFRPALRGKGAGRMLLTRILHDMRAAGFDEAYLETTTQMEAARALYRAFGFQEMAAPCGATGHHGCDRFFRLRLS